MWLQTNRNIRHKAHSIFGYYVALPALFGHSMVSMATAVVNEVNQSRYIQTMYITFIISSLYRTGKAMYYVISAREASGDRKKELIHNHKVIMFRNYIWTTFGSGGIRMASWFTWIVGE